MQSTTSIVETKSFATILEEEWVELSEELEEKHFDAAFEAKVAEIEIDSTNTTTTVDKHDKHSAVRVQLHPKKSNCYSPYVPSNALRIQGMIDFIKFHPSDVFCDMGCGDGRVCFVVKAAVQYVQQRNQQQNTGLNEKDVTSNQFRAIGIDVSKHCIDVAQKHLITNQYLSEQVKNCIQFYQADLTINPNELLNETSLLRPELLSVTVIYLYTYPTLLIQLIPLLSQLFQVGRLRAIVTLTYHIHQLPCYTSPNSNELDSIFELIRINEEHDLCLYTNRITP